MIRWLPAACLLALSPCSVWADEAPPASLTKLQAETTQLLTFIETSGCEMERNGKRHPPDEAARHVARKYEYFKKRIATAEDFIRLAAAGSTVSGKPYLALCPGAAPTPTAKWLTDELTRLRGE